MKSLPAVNNLELKQPSSGRLKNPDKQHQGLHIFPLNITLKNIGQQPRTS